MTTDNTNTPKFKIERLSVSQMLERYGSSLTIEQRDIITKYGNSFYIFPEPTPREAGNDSSQEEIKGE